MNIINIEPENRAAPLYGNYRGLRSLLQKDIDIIAEPSETIGTVKFVAENFSLNVPDNHFVGQIITRNAPSPAPVLYNGSRRAFELICILFDRPKDHKIFFTAKENEMAFIARFLQYLPDIVKLANLYNIKQIFNI